MDIPSLGRSALLFTGLASLAATGPLTGSTPVEIDNNRCIVPVYLRASR
jgi:hypothetical protein